MANFENFSNPYSRNLLLNNLKRICKSIMHMPIHMPIFCAYLSFNLFFFFGMRKKIVQNPFLHLGIIFYLCSEDPVCYCSQDIERFTVKRSYQETTMRFHIAIFYYF